MNTYRYCASLALLGLALTTSALAGKLETVGEISGPVVLTPATIEPGHFEYEYEATGVISNLGPVEFLVFGALNFDTNFNITPIPPTTFAAVVESGDAVFGTIRWRATIEGTNGYTLDGTYSITGGTGAFAKAKGGGVGVGIFDITSLVLTLHLDGDVTAPKKPKSVKPPKVKPVKPPKVKSVKPPKEPKKQK